MDSDITQLIIILILLILMSGYFSAAETAFSAINRIRLKNLANGDNKRAKAALELSKNYDVLLSTILIGNNVVNIAAASIGTVIFTRYFDKAGAAISTIVMTILILVFSEISPKSLAKEAPEKFAMWAAPGLRILVFIFKPLNFFFMSWKRLLSKVFKVSEDRSITEEELLTIIDEAQNEGGINEQEGELIRSAIEFNDLDVNDVLTPRVNVMAIDLSYSDEDIHRMFVESGYSRMPVYETSIDDIIGVIHEKNFHNYLHSGKPKASVRGIIKPVVWATATTKISKLLTLLQTTKSHMAVITDEYGGTAGIVTLEDILEELVGEIWDEHDEIIEEFVQLTDNEYKISGSANIDKMFDLFDIDEDYESNTVGGFVIGELGKIPNEGDSFVYEKLKITVIKTNFRRVIEVHVSVLEDCEGE